MANPHLIDGMMMMMGSGDIKQQQLMALKDIANKLTTLDKIKEDTCVLKDIRDAVLTFKGIAEDVCMMKEDIAMIKSGLSQISKDIQTPEADNGDIVFKTEIKSFVDFMLEDRQRNFITSEAYRYRKSVKKAWTSIKNMRKSAYFNSRRCSEIAVIYEKFLGQDNIFIPKKFRQQPIAGESDTQRQRRINVAITKMEAEVDNLKETACKNESIMSKCEEDIKALISKQSSDDVRQKLTELWLEEIRTEENTSNVIWEKKKRWFEDMERQETEESRAPSVSNNQQNRDADTADTQVRTNHHGNNPAAHNNRKHFRRHGGNNQNHNGGQYQNHHGAGNQQHRRVNQNQHGNYQAQGNSRNQTNSSGQNNFQRSNRQGPQGLNTQNGPWLYSETVQHDVPNGNTHGNQHRTGTPIQNRGPARDNSGRQNRFHGRRHQYNEDYNQNHDEHVESQDHYRNERRWNSDDREGDYRPSQHDRRHPRHNRNGRGPFLEQRNPNRRY